MRICYLADADSVHVQRWASWFARRGHEVHVLSARDAAIPSVQVHVLQNAGRSFLALPLKVREIRRLVAQVRPDVLHAHRTDGYGFWGSLAGHHPYVVSAWGSDVLVVPRRSRLQALLLRFLLRRADCCIPVADHLRASMVPLGLREDRTEVIPMGVELDRFPPLPYRAGERPASFVSTRNHYPIYDVGTLILAAKKVHDANPAIRGTVLGGGPQSEELRGLAAELGLAQALRFEGSVGMERLMAVLAASRVYVSTSTSDGASVSLLEAVARGCFPVVSDIPANREWVADGENGFLFPVGDADALAKGILRAMDDEGLLERAGLRNASLVRDRGDLGRNLERVEAAYGRLVAGAAAK